MTKQIESHGKKFWRCERCGLFYKAKALAEKCEKFCKENNACSIEITKRAEDLNQHETSFTDGFI